MSDTIKWMDLNVIKAWLYSQYSNTDFYRPALSNTKVKDLIDSVASFFFKFDLY